MDAGKMLLVADDLLAGQLWSQLLRQRGVEVLLAGTESEALSLWERQGFDLVIIDDNGHLDGLDICRQFRALAVNPILVLGPSDNDGYCRAAYAAGADECISKPLSPAIFLAKVGAWLRHSWTLRAGALLHLAHGDLRLEPELRVVVTGSGDSVRLTNLEFRLLYLLMSHQGQVLSADTIVEQVWGTMPGDGRRLIRHMIRHLRRKIEPDPRQPRYIKTVAGRGYVLAT